jgi:hypothetical protein
MANEKKTGAGNRRQFVRTQIPLGENLVSAALMLLLVLFGVAIAIKGRHFNPDIFNVRPDSLNGTATAVEGKSGTVRAQPQSAAVADNTTSASTPAPAPTAEKSVEDMQGESSAESASATPASNSSAAPKPALKNEPLEIALDGIKPMSDTEFYNSDNLFEKIDGRAPAYQDFNVQQLRCRSFSVNAAPGSYVDVYEYRFDSTIDAFGMFALERDPKGKPLDFAPDGYSGEMGYFFRQGPVYVQVIASDEKPETLALTKAIAQNRAKELPVDDSGLAGRRKLPADGMIASSVAFVSENGQGQASLKDVFQAKYNFDGAELPFFIMVATPDDAAKAWKSLQDFCARFGKTQSLPDMNGGKIFSAQVFGKWKVVYLRDGEIGGVFDATDSDKAQAFVEKYLRGEIK